MSSLYIKLHISFADESKAASALAVLRLAQEDSIKASEELSKLCVIDFIAEDLSLKDFSLKDVELDVSLQAPVGFEVGDFLDALEGMGATSIHGTILNDQVLEEWEVSRPNTPPPLTDSTREETAMGLSLVDAVESEPLPVIEAVLRRDPPQTYLAWRDAAVMTILHRDHDVLALLLRHGLPVRSELLFTTISRKKIDKRLFEIAKLLIESGIDPNCDLHEGITPLMLAVEHDSKSFLMTKYLLANGADINRTTGEEWNVTALHRAISATLPHSVEKRRKPALVRLLLERGADVTVKTAWGDDVVSVARKKINDKSDQENVIKMLEARRSQQAAHDLH